MTRTRPVEWLTAEEARDYLRFPSRKALYKAVERAQLPVHRLGRRLRFSRADLDALLQRRLRTGASGLGIDPACTVAAGKE